MQLMEKREGKLASVPVAPEFHDHYDVIVVGLGTAGSFAAIRAAGRGLKVLGIERLNCMGGTGTTGGVLGYYYGNRGGLFEELDREVQSYQGRSDFAPFLGQHPELKGWVMESEAMKAGADIRYDSYVIGVYAEGTTIKGLRWVSPDGVHKTSAKVVIDCSGNGEVCEMAGCEFQSGRALDGFCQPFSNVLIKLYPNGRPGSFYTDSGYIDVSSAEDVTRAIIESNLLGTHLQEKYTAEPMLLRTNQLLGIRESRNIVGEERVTFKDFLEDRITREPVFYGYSNLDNHGKDMAFESDTQQEWLVAASLFGLNFNAPVPRGALIPKGYDGLLAAGRCISLDHDIASAIRQKRDMQKCGETAANMAYLAIADRIPLKDVPYGKLLELQTETGCLGPEHKVEYREITPQESNEQVVIPSIKWLTELDDIKTALAGDKPGIAIWSARRAGAAIVDSLLEWMEEGDQPLLRKNSALALGLLGNRACLPVLREMVYSRDLYVPRSSRKYNQPHVFGAIYLLGAMNDGKIMPELLSIMKDDSFIDQVAIDSGNNEFIFDIKELYFQFFTFSMMAALRIAEKNEEWRAPVTDVLAQRFADPDFDLFITLKTHIKEANGFLKKKMKYRVERVYEQAARRWG